MKQTHLFRANHVPAVLRCGFLAVAMICALLLLPALLLSACGGGEPSSGDPASGDPAAVKAERPEPVAAQTPRNQRRAGDTMDPSTFKDRGRDGAALAVADTLRPELAGALPPSFPDDIPLGNWLSVSSVRRLGETDFVLSCSTSYRRGAVGEFFVHHMPENGWKLVNRSSKPILSVFTFRKDERAVTVMVKKQVMNQGVAFDLSYKEN